MGFGLGLGLAAFGALLLWGAVKGENPLLIVRDILQGRR